MYFKKENEELTPSQKKVGLILVVVFLLILAIGSRVMSNFSSLEDTTNNTTKDGSPVSDVDKKMNKATEDDDELKVFKEIEKGNFEFIYTINDNGNTTIYSGKSNTNKQSIDVYNRGTARYYKLGDSYLDKNYNVINNPLTYEKFTDIDNLKELYYFTDFDNNEKGLVSVYDVFKIYYNDFGYNPFDIDDIEDSKVEVTLKNGGISKVQLDFSTATTYMKQTNYTFTVTLEYSNIGDVEELQIG